LALIGVMQNPVYWKNEYLHLMPKFSNMKKKELEDLTTEELKSKIMILKAVLLIMSILVVLYLVFFIYKLSAGTWEANNALGTVMVGMLVVVISSTTVQYSRIAKILKNRTDGI